MIVCVWILFSGPKSFDDIVDDEYEADGTYDEGGEY